MTYSTKRRTSANKDVSPIYSTGGYTLTNTAGSFTTHPIQEGGLAYVNSFALFGIREQPGRKVAVLMMGEGVGKSFLVPGLSSLKWHEAQKELFRERLVQTSANAVNRAVAEIDLWTIDVHIGPEPLRCSDPKHGKEPLMQMAVLLRDKEKAHRRSAFQMAREIDAKITMAMRHPSMANCTGCRWIATAQVQEAKLEFASVAMSNIFTQRFIGTAKSLSVNTLPLPTTASSSEVLRPSSSGR